MSTMEDLKKTLDEGLNIARESVAFAAERAEDLSRVAALRLQIFAARRRVERLYGEIGEAVYRLAGAKGDVWSDAAVKKAVKEIAALEAKVNELFAKLDALSTRAGRGRKRAHASDPRPAASKPRRRKPA